jgi:putative ABC transport system permease protein
MVLAQVSPLAGEAVWPVVLASLSLVGLALGLAWWLGLGIERDVIWASARAAIQLLAVGLLFSFIFESDLALVLALTWVAVMVSIGSIVVRRRADHPIPGLGWASLAAVLGTAAISLAVVFGFGVFEWEPVSVVVVAGITIGNAVPSAVLGVNQAVNLSRDHMGEIEAALALGMSRRQVVRFMAPRAARSAVIPQVERTKVVGLIALPGAMTGLLLAGVDPFEAVVIQLVVMYLVLGTAAVCVVTVVATVTRASVTDDLRVAHWATHSSIAG